MLKPNIPVYLFTGFLESGKTTFIQDTLQDKEFNSGENVLVLICEEGIEEYDPSAMASKNVYFQTIDSEEMLTRANLATYQKKYKAKHVMIEYNGMWQLNTLFNALPEGWFIYREMCFFDATTFNSYNANLRSLVVDKLMTAEMVVFNRAPEDVDKDFIHKTVRGVSRGAQIALIFPDGKVYYDETEDPLPFDLNANVINIEDRDYALWYRDIAESEESMKKYDGKVVRFKGRVFDEKRMGMELYLIGRHVMVCCQDDITYRSLICRFGKKPPFKTNDWVTVTARITLENHKMYETRGPILNIMEIEAAQPPEQEVATFY